MNKLHLSIYLSIFLSGFIFSVQGQSVELRGYIRDSIGKGIPFISIFLKKQGENKVVKYCYSNDNGYYSLHIKEKGSFNLHFSGLSVKKAQIPVVIDSISVGKKITKNIVLKGDVFQLDEIVVNANRDITYKGDTVSINTSAFTIGNEEVVEDILKKLPWISVDSDGVIKVYGKVVEKVMIDGQDLFEKGYRILTQNLDAKVISKVEILKHFSGNPILKGIEDSDKIALNLTLKKNIKKALFGNANLGYGTSKYYDCKLSIMSLLSKLKGYFLGRTNNTGNISLAEMYPLHISPNYSMRGNNIVNNVSARPLISLRGGGYMKNNRTNFNKLKLYSISGVYRPTNKLQLKGLFIVKSADTDFFKSRIEQYLLKDYGINTKNTEKYKLRKSKLSLMSRWNAVYTIDKGKRLDYIGKYSKLSGSENSNTDLNKLEFADNLDNEYWLTDQLLTYTNKINNTSAFQITSRYVHDAKPQDYFVNKFLLENIFPKAKETTSVRQYANNKVDFWGTEGAFYNSKNKNKLNLRVGYLYKKIQLNSSLFLVNSKDTYYKQGDAYTNHMINYTSDLYGEFKYKYVFEPLSFQPSLEVHKRYNYLTNKDENTKDNKFYIESVLPLSWTINKINKLNISYTHYKNNMLDGEVYNGFILYNYNSLKKGLGANKQVNSNKLSLLYSLYPMKNNNWAINTMVSYISFNNYLASKHIISPNSNTIRDVFPHNRKVYISNINVRKFFESIRSMLKFSFRFLSTKSQNIINDSGLREIKRNSYNYSINIKSALKGVFNFSAITSWSTSYFDLISKSVNSSSSLTLNFKISEKINFDIENDFYYYSNSSSNNKYLFTDINAKWKLNSSMSVKLIASNIFNINHFTKYYITDYSTESISYKLIPRYFVIRFDFRF